MMVIKLWIEYILIIVLMLFFIYKFANRNNFYHKVLQDSTESTPFELNDSKITDITINLDKNTYYTFPYMDTLKYIITSNVLSNKKRCFFIIK
jgi:hypothetical protein